MIDNSRIVLEDNIEYDVIEKIKDQDHYYVFLSNVNDIEDIVVRKEIVEEKDGIEEHTLVGLDNEEELDKALNLFLEKNSQE